MIIEAMVAAPLVAFGMTHPEGHDFLGRAQQAGMMLLNLCLRPSLMLIGLFAGGILCHVAMSFWVYSFSGFVADIFYHSGPIDGQASGVLSSVGTAMSNIIRDPAAGGGLTVLFIPLALFVIFLVVFTGGVYVITINSFSLIHHLPEYVGGWIGIQQHGPNAQQMAESVKGIGSAAGEKLGGFLQTRPGEHKKKDKTKHAAELKND